MASAVSGIQFLCGASRSRLHLLREFRRERHRRVTLLVHALYRKHSCSWRVRPLLFAALLVFAFLKLRLFRNNLTALDLRRQARLGSAPGCSQEWPTYKRVQSLVSFPFGPRINTTCG